MSQLFVSGLGEKSGPARCILSRMGKAFKVGLIALTLLVLSIVALGTKLPAALALVNSPPIQLFFVPLPDDQVHTALNAMMLNQGRPLGNTMHSIVSIVATLDGTVIYYDHWEDGYEVDLLHPVQSTTEIWGDGNPANGIPPGYSTDLIGTDDVIALEEDIDVPRSAAELHHDGGDKFGANRVIVVARAEWATDPGSVLAGAVEVYDTSEYGTYFEIPIGEDVPDDNGMFNYVSLLVMASQDGTTLQVDLDGDGVVDDTVVLNQGESYHADGGVQSGASVRASRPVQVHVITGDPYEPRYYYESRWYAMYPVEEWGSGYFSPVGTSRRLDGQVQQTYILIYNPGETPITVNYDTRVGSGSFNVAANGVYWYEMPENSAAHLYTADGSTFFAVATVGANPSANSSYEWGFSLVPEGELTTAAVVGWGPGNGLDDPTGAANGSPVWVTSATTLTLYVDYDGNPTTGPLVDPNGNHYDVDYLLLPLESLKVYDNSDNDQTGMRLYTLEGGRIATAWGEDPSTANSLTPFLDLGYTVKPLQPRVVVDKELAASHVDVVNGSVVTFTIAITNIGSSVIDVLPLNDTYDPFYLSFMGAVPYPEEDADDGIISWNDLTGPAPHGFDRNLPPGASFIITTTFRVVHDITSTVNTASISDVVDIYDNDANEDDDGVEINDIPTIPTAVELLYFRVGGVAGTQVRLEWATAVEIDTFGFRLYRASSADRSRAVPVAFVPSAAHGGGAAYSYTDTVPSPGIWWYWLADVDTIGNEVFHGPVSAGVGVAVLPYQLYLPLVLR